MLKSTLDETDDKRVTNFQLLLENPKQQQLINLANMISPNNQFAKDQDNLGISLTKKKYTEQYNKTFTRKEIIQDAVKYNLAFVQGRDFKGEYTISFLEKLQFFLEEKKIAASQEDLRTQIWVLASAEKDCKELKIKESAKDPLMFYEITKGYFVLIDGTKDYVTLLNRWSSYCNFSENQCRRSRILESLLVIILLNWLILSIVSHDHTWTVFTYFYVPILSFFIGIIRMAGRESFRDTFNHYASYFNAYKYSY